MEKITIDVTIPVLCQTLQLMVPKEMLGGHLLDAVEELVLEQFGFTRRANLYFAHEGYLMDYELPLGHLPLGTKLILM